MATTQSCTEHEVVANGVRLHYVTWGRPGLPPMLWVHGMSGTAHYWDLVAPAFADRYHIVCPTLRGRGRSEFPVSAAYATDDYVTDLRALLHYTLGWDRFTYVGASLGGRIGLRWAAGHPGEIDRMVLVDIGAQVGDPNRRAGGDRFADAPESFNDLAEAEGFLRQFDLFAKLDRPAMEVVLREGFLRDADGRWQWAYDRAIRDQRRRAIQSGRNPFTDQWGDAKATSAPALIIRGARSDVLDPNVARRTAEAIGICTVAEIPDAGHLPYLEKREEFVRLLDSFLQEGQ